MTNITTIISFLLANQLYAALVALPILAGLNILEGWALANFAKTYDKAKMTLGLKKGLVVYFTIGVLSIVAEFFTVAELDIKSTIALIVYTVAAYYLIQVLDKLKSVIGYKEPVKVI